MRPTTTVRMSVNGRAYETEVEPRLLLVHYLRDKLGLTGTNVGCDTTNCGACTVHLNGEAVKSCKVLAVQAEGAEVRTIEGMGRNGSLHPLQEAFTGAALLARVRAAGRGAGRRGHRPLGRRERHSRVQAPSRADPHPTGAREGDGVSGRA